MTACALHATHDPLCPDCVAIRNSVTLRAILAEREEREWERVRGRMTRDDSPEALVDAIVASAVGTVE